MRLSSVIAYACLFLVSISCASALGDVNNDGVVNTADLLIIIGDLGKTSGFNPNSDVRADGVINLYDLVVVGQNWGTTATSNATILFQSDWSTATGSSDAAIRDTNQATPWTLGATGGGTLNVVSATGLGFPAGMTNVLRVARGPTSGGSSWAQLQNIPAINVGESLYYRVYLRNDLYENGVVVLNNAHHPIETAYLGGYADGFVWKLGTNGDGTYPLAWNMAPNQNSYPFDGYAPGRNSNGSMIGETYRLEWGLTKTAVNQYRINAHIYNSSGALVWDNTTILAQGINSSANCNFCSMASVTSPRTINDSEITKFRVGTNGGGPWTGFSTNHYFYFGGVAICKNNWCGPYTTNASSTSLSGTVTNTTGGGVSGTIQVFSGATNIANVTVANNGSYSSNLSAGTYTLKLQPSLSYSLGPSEPDNKTVTISSGTTTANFIVQPALYADDFQTYTTAPLLGGCASPLGDSVLSAGEFFYGTNHVMGACSANTTWLISMDSTGGTTAGQKAARYDWPSGNGGSVYLGPRINSPPNMSELWVRWTSKESIGFVHGGNGATGSANEYKFFLIQVSPCPNGCPQFGTYLDNAAAGLGVDPTRITFDSVDRLGNNGNSLHTLSYNLGSNWSGKYHTWVAGVTGMGTNNMTYQIYYDGTLILEVSAPFLPGQTVGGPGQMIFLNIGANINNGPDNPQSRWFRELGIYTRRPSLLPMTIADTTAPTVSNGTPTGSQPAGTTSALLQVLTNEAASCRYSTTAGTAYASMTPFNNTGSTIHNVTITGLTNGQTYNQYVKCQDGYSNTNAADYTITFNVLNPVSGQYESICPGGSNPRSDIIWCTGFENYSSPSCSSPSSQSCFTANNAGSTSSSWSILGGDAAVGNGAVVSREPPGSDGSGFVGYDHPDVANISMRYYVKFSNGFLFSSRGTGDHGPAFSTTGPCGLLVSPDIGYYNNLNWLVQAGSCTGLTGGVTTLGNNIATPQLKNNRWYLIEMQANMNTITTGTGGRQGNGVFRAYVDGVKVAEYTDINYRGTTNELWAAALTARELYQSGGPSWNATKLFDNFVISNNGSYIGPAANENPRGTADSLSPYMNIMAYNGMNLRRNAPGCANISNYGLTGYGNDAAFPLSTTAISFPQGIAHIGYTDRCANAIERAMKVNLSATQTTAASIMSETYPNNMIVNHGWVYLPSSNTYNALLSLSGFGQNGWWDNCNGPGQGCGFEDYNYLGVGVDNGQWAIVYRNGNNANLGTRATLVKTGTVTLDTWHEYELAVKSNHSASLAIDGTWLFTDVPVNPWVMTPVVLPGGAIKSELFGIDYYNGTRPFTVYFDDVDIGSASFWSCVGWNVSSCPFD
jgi:hypothetical protein